jgi:hypothetical protein
MLEYLFTKTFNSFHSSSELRELCKNPNSPERIAANANEVAFGSGILLLIILLTGLLDFI